VSFLPTYVGSFSQPAAENPTVVMIEAAFRHAAMDWRYLNCEVAPEGLAAAVAGARPGLGRLQLLAPAQGGRDRPDRRAR
jgi:shikimate 5-dehydrogenase